MAKKLRQLRMGLTTVLGLARQGFFIPYRYAGEIPGHAVAEDYRPLTILFGKQQEQFRDILSICADWADELIAICNGAPPAPRFDQDWFPTLDAAVAYCLIRHEKPVRLLEIGSGHSTRFFAQAVRDGGLACEITAVDPAPRASIQGLPVRFIRRTLQEAISAAEDPLPIGVLSAGDVISIDSSHILMPGTDVDVFLNRIVPVLPKGILIHIHDIFLPEAYPSEWAWRGYNEQNAVASLISGGSYELLFASHYVAQTMAQDLSKSVLRDLPTMPDSKPASLWLRKTR